MPKMTHWNSPEPIEVSSEKAAVYQAQGWQTVDKARTAPKVSAMTTEAASESAPKPAKKAPAKKATKKAAKKS